MDAFSYNRYESNPYTRRTSHARTRRTHDGDYFQEFPGYRIVRNFGIVRGIIVRSRSLLGSIGAGLQTIIGGNITLLTELCEKTREEAYELMMQHAAEHGANAVLRCATTPRKSCKASRKCWPTAPPCRWSEFRRLTWDGLQPVRFVNCTGGELDLRGANPTG